MNKAHTYSYEDIQRYLQHKMNAKEMHAFERAMMDDPFLADAMEGYKKSNNLLVLNHLGDIKKRITTNKQPAKIVSLPYHQTQWRKVAAVVFIIITGAALSYMFLKTSVNNEHSASQIAQTKSAEIPIIKDSIEPDSNKLLTERASSAEGITYRKNASPIIHKNAKAPPAAIIVPQPKHDNAMLAMTDKMDERTLITNNETASANTPMPQARRSATVSASAANQELKETTAQSNAPVKVEAFAKRSTSKKDSNALNEVTVKGYEATTKRDAAGSVTTIKNEEQFAGEPEGGWKNFDNYIKREMKSFKDSADTASNKTITLEFLIDEEGRPSDIQIKDEADKTVADKAIEVLRNGPRWIRNKAQSKVKVTIGF